MMEIFGIVIQYAYYLAVILFVLKEFNVPYVRNYLVWKSSKRTNTTKSKKANNNESHTNDNPLENLMGGMMEMFNAAVANNQNLKQEKIEVMKEVSTPLADSTDPIQKESEIDNELIASTAELDENFDE